MLITATCIVFFWRKSQNDIISPTFVLQVMFHHKYKDKNFSGVNKKQVSLPNKFPCQTSFPAKWFFLPNEFPCQTNLPAKWIFLSNEFPCQTNFPAKRVFVLNEFPCQKSFPAKRVSLSNEFPCQTRFANFQRPNPPLNKGEDLPAMKDLLRVLIFC